ncbi:MAG: hypothetical protein QQN63_10215 [Nitrosopumilus sp.]
MPERDPLSDVVNTLIRTNRVIIKEETINPMDDNAFKQLANFSEANDGKLGRYKLILQRILVERNCKLNPNDEVGVAWTECTEARVKLSNSQEFDRDYWTRLRRKYESKYPKTFQVIKDSLKIKSTIEV